MPSANPQEQLEEVEVSVSGEASLSEQRPSASLEPIHVLAAPSLGFTKGHVQILTGDFNAEPNEPAYRYITGDHEETVTESETEGQTATEAKRESGSRSGLETESELVPNFRDAWLLGGRSEHESDGYTFPSCNPIKRIDFILVRNATTNSSNSSNSNRSEAGRITAGQWRAEVVHTWRVGLAPTPETADRIGVSTTAVGK